MDRVDRRVGRVGRRLADNNERQLEPAVIFAAIRSAKLGVLTARANRRLGPLVARARAATACRSSRGLERHREAEMMGRMEAVKPTPLLLGHRAEGRMGGERAGCQDKPREGATKGLGFRAVVQTCPRHELGDRGGLTIGKPVGAKNRVRINAKRGSSGAFESEEWETPSVTKLNDVVR